MVSETVYMDHRTKNERRKERKMGQKKRAGLHFAGAWHNLALDLVRIPGYSTEICLDLSSLTCLHGFSFLYDCISPTKEVCQGDLSNYNLIYTPSKKTF